MNNTENIEPVSFNGRIFYSIKTIREMRDAGYSWIKIGGLHGVSHVAVRYWYRKYENIPAKWLNKIGDYQRQVGLRGRRPRDEDPHSRIITLLESLPDIDKIIEPLYTIRGNMVTKQEKVAFEAIISFIETIYDTTLNMRV